MDESSSINKDDIRLIIEACSKYLNYRLRGIDRLIGEYSILDGLIRMNIIFGMILFKSMRIIVSYVIG